MSRLRDRVTQSDVAAAAEVTRSTVSLALRNDPRLPAATRRRIQAVADNLGYRPDPEIGRLMARLREGRRAPPGAPLGLLTAFERPDPWKNNPFTGRAVFSARERAAQLGYDLDTFWLNHEQGNPERLRRVLLTRGIGAVLLLNTPEPWEDYPFDLSPFALATLGYSLNLPVHRASAHVYLDTLKGMQRLYALGYRRPGFVANRSSDARVRHLFQAAFLVGQRLQEDFQRLDPLVVKRLNAEVLTAWYRRYRPDVIITHAPPVGIFREWLEDAGVAVPAEVALVSLDLPTESIAVSGILQNHEAVAAAAVDLLVAQIQVGEKGYSEAPKTTLIEGRWVDGGTAPPRGR